MAALKYEKIRDARVVKVDFFANGKLIDNWVQNDPNDTEDRYVECHLTSLADGRYEIQAVATDSDGSIAKSAVVEIVIKRH